MPQLSIPDDIPVGFKGQLAEPGAPKYARSASADFSSGTLEAGDPVIRGTVPGKDAAPIVTASDVTAESFFGFVILETSRPFDATAMIADDDPVAVLQEGHMYLDASEVVTAGEAVGLVQSSGALVGLGSDETPAAGTIRLPGCRWEETIAAAGLAVASIRIKSAAGSSFALSAEFLVSGGAGTDIAEQIIGVVPSDCKLIGARYVPAGAITAGTGATAMNLEINKRTNALPATQVAVALGSNVAAEPQDWNEDGALGAWEAGAFLMTGGGVEDLSAGDVITFELIAGASATYPAGMIVLELRTFA